MKNVAVILSGCGNKDGAEITESVSTLLALAEAKINYKIFAPRIDFQALNFLTGEKGETRNVLVEAARIARGDIQDLSDLHVKNFDAVIFPGGFGAATLLCDFAQKGAKCSVQPSVQRVIEEFHKEQKPIGAICIAPALIARVLGKHGVHVTIGDDKETAHEIEKTGAHHVTCPVTDFVSDRENKIVTTPAYMYPANPFDVYTGIRKAVRELVEMA